LALHPANARLQGDLGIAYLQRARETNDPSYYAKAHTLLERSLERDPSGLDATIGEGSLAVSYHDFRKALQLGTRALALSHGFSPPALAMVGDASVELGRYEQGFAAFRRLGELRPGLVAYARLSYAHELQGDVAGATRLMRRAVDAGSGAPENTQWTRVQLAALLLKSGRTDAAAGEYRHALALLPH
jgi:tetratricopeptide (TPR) repeat protein